MNYEVGQDVLALDGEFLGVYVKNASDFTIEDPKEKEIFIKSLLKQGPNERLVNKSNDFDSFRIYGVRKVFVKGIGVLDQCLVKTTGLEDLSWINYKPQNYISKPIMTLNQNKDIVEKEDIMKFKEKAKQKFKL